MFNDGLLFSGQALVEHLKALEEVAVVSVDAVATVDLLGPDDEPNENKVSEFVSAVAEPFRMQPLKFDFDSLTRTPLTEDNGVMATSITVPFTGTPGLLNFQLNHVSAHGDDLRGTVVAADSDAATSADTGVAQHRLVFWLRSHDLGLNYESLLATQRQRITSKIDFANRVVADWNNKLENRLRTAALARAGLLRRMQAAEAAMTIPITRRVEPTISLPVQRRTLTPPTAPTTMRAGDTAHGASAWVLEEAAYEEVLRTLVLFAAAAGRLPASVGKLSENDLRNFALLVLNANFSFTTARGEVFNGDGKSDLLVPWETGNAFVGEFKRYDGAESIRKALTQLLGYVTWADTKAALVVIVDRHDVSHALAEVDRAVQEHPQHRRTLKAADPDRRRDYVVASIHDPAREVRLAVIPIVVYGERKAAELPPDPTAST